MLLDESIYDSGKKGFREFFVACVVPADYEEEILVVCGENRVRC